jgi:hypothetical protein
MTREPLLNIPEGKPREARAGVPVHPVTAEEWFAAPPENTTPVEQVDGELAPPGPAAVQHHVDIPVQPDER